MTALKHLPTSKKSKSLSSIVIIVCLLSVFSSVRTFGQLSISSEGTPFTIDFDNSVTGVNNGQFAGSGFQSAPSAGQIDSDGIIVTNYHVVSKAVTDKKFLAIGIKTYDGQFFPVKEILAADKKK